jgi:hypothetical protein
MVFDRGIQTASCDRMLTCYWFNYSWIINEFEKYTALPCNWNGMVEFSSHFDLADLINNSVVRLNKIGLTGHPCFMPPFTGIGSVSSSFRILTMVEVQMSFIKLIRDCENHMCSRLLQIPSCEILPNVLRRSNHATKQFFWFLLQSPTTNWSVNECSWHLPAGLALFCSGEIRSFFIAKLEICEDSMDVNCLYMHDSRAIGLKLLGSSLKPFL